MTAIELLVRIMGADDAEATSVPSRPCDHCREPSSRVWSVESSVIPQLAPGRGSRHAIVFLCSKCDAEAEARLRASGVQTTEAKARATA